MWSSEECEMEKIICKKKVDNKWFYLIKWAGYSSKQNTWEEEKNIYCKEMLDDFETEWRQKKIKKSNNNKNYNNSKKLRKIRSNDNMGFADLFSKHLQYNRIKEENNVFVEDIDKIISLDSSNDDKKIKDGHPDKKKIDIFSSITEKKESATVKNKRKEKKNIAYESSEKNSNSFIVENSNVDSDSILVVENKKNEAKKSDLIAMKKNKNIDENKEYKDLIDEKRFKEDTKVREKKLDISQGIKKEYHKEIKKKNDKLININNKSKYDPEIFELETNILSQKEITPKNCFISDYIWMKNELYFLISEKNKNNENIKIGYFSKKYCTKMIPSKLCKFYEKYIIVKNAPN